MKKIFLIMFIAILSILPHYNVSAEEVYYTNSNGVDFTRDEYDYFSEMFWDGYQEYVTRSEFDQVANLDLFNQPIYKNTYTTPVDFNSLYYTNGNPLTEKSRTITLSKSCSSTCFLSLVNVWNATPNVKSWDVFGARASGATITTVNTALMYGDTTSVSYLNPTIAGGGFGYSMLVPNDTGIKSAVSFYSTTGGTIYGTYQHAMTGITEANSHLYNIVYYGYGGVFNFYGAAFGIYDGCNGVNISV